jgi:F-type H+-transporting ATPase subunit gamma
VPSVRDLRDRIKSFKSTQQITKAMKQVAAAKIRRAEILQKQSRPYADQLAEMLRDLMESVGTVDHPFLKPGAPGAPAGVILMTADKGLCGAFNENLVRAADQFRRSQESVTWYTVGVKARNGVRRFGSPSEFWPLSQGDKLVTARTVSARVSDDFVAGKISSIVVISPKLVSMMSQRPEVRNVVPIVGGRAEKAEYKGSVEFAPSPEAVLSRLLPKYLDFTIYSSMLETDAAFFAAQLVAMNNATENATKLIDQLTIQMNKARQASITTEILEIVGGAEALAG